MTFNGVRLSEKQMPEVYAQTVRAARILGMSHMPDVYISGEYMWDCMTFGTDKDSFVVIGTALAMNFRGDDLLFCWRGKWGVAVPGTLCGKQFCAFFSANKVRKKD
ncbi:MAG TPA: hypothetical protein VF556_07275 [Pyrinomonadaceae bacterium]